MAVLTKNALEILEDRYLLRNTNNELVETAITLFKRVSKHIASVETKHTTYWEKQFFSLLDSLDFLPNSPTLMNAGLPNGQLSACFVLPVPDHLKGIFTTLMNTALIHQSGGGTGFNFSKLRPMGDYLSSTGGYASGPLAFMHIFDAATENVKQGGKRRGANMGVLNIDHPDIETFIASKADKKSLQNFNTSVGITDAFMKAVVSDTDWDLINPRSSKKVKTLRATYLWNLIVTNAWETGDPGLIFLDTINRNNPTPKFGKIDSTNPCGEVPLLAYESCNLGSINLSQMIIIKNGQSKLDWEKLERTIAIAIRFLDNMIDANYYLLPETAHISKKNRKIGLGVMGWAELLIQLEINYASMKAVSLGKKVMKFIQLKSYEASRSLAKEKNGTSRLQLRNITCNSIAPTGTISVIANTSYSIEPLFAIAYKRKGVLEDTTQVEINKYFIRAMTKLGLWTNEIKKNILEQGDLRDIVHVPKNLKNLFKTSIEIPWKYHLKHQQAFQMFTDNAVSKTVNLPENCSLKDISDIYKTSWIYQLKGITIYRNGSREKQVIQKCNYNSLTSC